MLSAFKEGDILDRQAPAGQYEQGRDYRDKALISLDFLTKVLVLLISTSVRVAPDR
jgi:hypothetical protein